ncbi:putative oxidoreductase [Oceanospirillum multiglobuliferum]|uniref:DoxX family protein n=1 Tax=Oceanospirillum multiglobuliferum TaxID=64969 RepID=A0A1T4PR62_9GAMM|nr:DoxX family protein [Oceanospirillum multiglobuliferum]OPX55354.1 hypothetical protein BTE48_09315 [Oceanospirillum multiglobuliferum]SJZ94124.1 putative oxidoreductase [Oceanospirillum multiglobuliferum]
MNLHQLSKYYTGFFQQLETWLTPILLLFVRFWAAKAFFQAGLVKIASWDSTLYLFESEYQVPIIPWQWAAYLGTGIELLLPPLLLLGLLSRMTATVLFLFNIMAVISYPLLWEQGFYDHQLWGLMLLMTAIFGAGKLSADQLLKRRYCQ